MERIIVKLLILLFSFLGIIIFEENINVEAKNIPIDKNRSIIISQEMDSISAKTKKNMITWEDICYTDSYIRNQYNPHRLDKINKVLDIVEKGIKREKRDRRAYPSALSSVYRPSHLNKIGYNSKNMDSSISVKVRNWDKKQSYTNGQIWNKNDIPIKGQIQIIGGYRCDDIDWNIASDLSGTATPNILSELTWSDLKMSQIKIKAELSLYDTFIIDGMAAYSDIYEGENQDSDYLGNNRTGESSRSNNRSDDGEAIDLSVAGGYRVYLGNRNDYDEYLAANELWCTLLAGYSHHEQHLIITDGVQTIPALGPLPSELHSNYNAEWKGPWIGLELYGKKENLSGFFRFEYHWPEYDGDANWNLRDDLQHPKSFEHSADGGRGLVFSIGGNYKVTDSWRINFAADIQQWKTDPGIHRTFFSDGSTIETRLNEVNWQSHAIRIGASYLF